MRLFLLLALVSVTLAPGGASAMDRCGPLPPGQIEGRVTPDPRTPPSLPTEIAVGLDVLDINQIDVIAGRFALEAWALFEWCDPRLAFDPAQQGAPEILLRGEAAFAHMNATWQPDLNPANGSAVITKRVLRVRPDGTIQLQGLFTVDLSQDYDLRRFPIDRQHLQMQIESFTWNESKLVFRPLPNRIGYSGSISIPEWRIEGTTARAESVALARDATPFSRIVVSVEIAREYGFYVLKVAIPLAMIVALSWAVFWMGDESFGARTRTSATGVLTVVAYQFAIAATLPRVSYLTLLDKLLVASFTLIALTVLENLLVSRAAVRDPAAGERIDRHARWIFPLAFAVTIGLVFVTQP